MRALQAQRRIEQGLAEMVGLVRGVVADGVVSSDEATRLAEWTRANPEPAARWPANILARRLGRIFADGRLDGRERDRLATLLAKLARNPEAIGRGFPLATDLPITRPEPDVVFEGQTFVFAGELVYGPTRACEREVLELGGTCERTINRRTDYVVIGSIAASDWSQSAFGGLVDEVVQYRSRGIPIAVITEEHWASALP
ncbi:MAG: BRCT domain-containing protein [Longimicrobiales bacterium]